MPPVISLAPPLGTYTVSKGMAVYDFEAKLVRHAAPTLAGIKPANLFTWRAAGFTEDEVKTALAEVSARLEPYGVRIDFMANRAGGALVLAWREDLAQAALDDADAQRIAAEAGFASHDARGFVAELQQRIARADEARLARIAAGIEPAQAAEPEKFIPCCGRHGQSGAHGHMPGHVCQCRAKAALSREEAQATQNEPGFPHEIGLILGYPPADVEGFIKNKGASFVACGGWKAYANPKGALEAFQRNRRCTDEFRSMYAQGAPLEALASMSVSAAPGMAGLMAQAM